jgi:hypothetical protein
LSGSSCRDAVERYATLDLFRFETADCASFQSSAINAIYVALQLDDTTAEIEPLKKISFGCGENITKSGQVSGNARENENERELTSPCHTMQLTCWSNSTGVTLMSDSNHDLQMEEQPPKPESK